MSPRHGSSCDVRRNLTDRLARSRDFTISLILHLILIVTFGSKILFEAVKEPSDFVAPDSQLIAPEAKNDLRPKDVTPVPARPEMLNPPTAPTPTDIITARIPPRDTIVPNPRELLKNPDMLPPKITEPAPAPTGENLTSSEDKARAIFREQWVKTGTSSQKCKYQFTAYVGQYGQGDWNSTNQVANNIVETGSLPNLLYFMNAFSNSRVATNYENVKAIRLDSDALFTEHPPFLFLTGTRDFKLSDREIENLRKYLMLGGAVWGDSSVPGKNSRFDIAFRREMKKVVGNMDTDWEALLPQHPIFTKAFFPEVRGVPAGLNSYQEPVEVLKIQGEIAVLYTANDYGNMWQVGLDKSGKIDLRRNERGAYVATSEKIWSNRDTYLRNLSSNSLMESYKFGTNIVIHLLTRWENVSTQVNRL